MALRYMQREAVDAVFAYWSESEGNCLVDMAGGSGKSMTMATLAKECMDGWGLRVLNVAHREELVEGNFKEFLGIAPFHSAGVYAASLGQRDARSQIVFGQIQTIYNKAQEIGHVDLLEIDEVHLVPDLLMDILDGKPVISGDETTQYGQLIRELLAINPDMKIVGFSATIYRTSSGRLDEGEGRMWDKCVYTYSLTQGMDDGYLAPLTSKGMSAKFDLTGVRTQGGDYKAGELQSAVDVPELTAEIVAEAMSWSGGRKTTLWFCSGVEHALHVRDAIRAAGKSCETITGKTPKGERRRIIAAMKSGELWACTNDAVLTVGTNIPNIDMIVDMGPTKSCSRFVQKIVRGTRPVYPRGFNPDGEGVTAEDRRNAIAVGPKPDCLCLDFAKNVEYHNSVDKAQPRVPGSGQGLAPIKQCPSDKTDINGRCGCDELIPISVMICPKCEYVFPPSEEEKLTRAPGITPILSTEKPWSEVTGRAYAAHQRVGSVYDKQGNDLGPPPPTVKASYKVGSKTINEWICAQHMEHPDPSKRQWGKGMSDKYWLEHGGLRPFPKSVDEFLDRAGELIATTEVQLDYSKSSKFPNIVARRTGDATYGTDVVVPAQATAKTGNLAAVLGTSRKVDSAAADRAAAERKAELRAFAEDFIPF